MICQVCDKPGHSAKKCYHRFDVTYRDNAVKTSNLHGLMATTGAVSPPDWHPDTGATHHLTNNMANLNLRSEDYTGSDRVLVGDGAGLQISQIGSSILTPFETPFVLKQILLVQ
jgi:histone deacetylase 1/2